MTRISFDTGNKDREEGDTHAKTSLILVQARCFSNANLAPNSEVREGNREAVGMIKVPGIKPRSLGI